MTGKRDQMRVSVSLLLFVLFFKKCIWKFRKLFCGKVGGRQKFLDGFVQENDYKNELFWLFREGILKKFAFYGNMF